MAKGKKRGRKRGSKKGMDQFKAFSQLEEADSDYEPGRGVLAENPFTLDPVTQAELEKGDSTY